jgi:hypothetical protein
LPGLAGAGRGARRWASKAATVYDAACGAILDGVGAALKGITGGASPALSLASPKNR